MKKEPRRPQTAPIMIAAGMSRMELSVSPSLPNLRAALSYSDGGTPSHMELRKDKTNVLRADAANTLHSMLKVQKVFGFDISYEKSAPPMGAPKAALTPADAPAATIYLFVTSFCKHLKLSIGR